LALLYPSFKNRFLQYNSSSSDISIRKKKILVLIDS
jgi:hypothetical protein